ncbi:MAG TPA: NUDIX domain-containing protein [Clostridia bacterium]|nr:NUDIX domain-containing protein [Clostridia bacterium]
MAELLDVYDAKGQRTGRTRVRGEDFGPEEYHLVACAVVRNCQGKLLFSRRAPEKSFAGLWEASGGAARAGEDSLTAAVRELGEELGLSLPPESGTLLGRYARQGNASPYFLDVWVFERDISLAELTLQPGETDAALLASAEEVRQLVGQGRFLPLPYMPYLEDLLRWTESPR